MTSVAEDAPAAPVVARRAVPGEGAPRWLGVVFALTGASLAAGGGWLLLADRSTEPDAPAPSAAPAPAVSVAADGGPSSVVAPAGPTPSPAPVPSPAGADPVPAAAPASAEVACSPAALVRFALGAVTPLERTDLDAAVLVAWLAADPSRRLLVEGHADSVGTEDDNLLLSHRRAKAVGDLLTSAGASPERVLVRAIGEAEPLVPEQGEAADNRRVVVRYGGPPACLPGS